MKFPKIAIVVIAYNRLYPVKRLLKSLSDAVYPPEYNPTLIISVDKGGNKELEEYVTSYFWKYGEKEIILHKEKLGLKKHVLSCGDLAESYDVVIALEDDLYVSPNFFIYAVKGITFFGEDTNIAGLSLYNIEINQSSMLAFEPEYNGYDNYFIQYAQSWGQVWSKNQWANFREWYKKNEFRNFDEIYIPWNIRNWGEKSWLRYFMLYCLENNKFFVYPYKSLSSNFSETGEHNRQKNSSFQVSLDCRVKREYSFVSLSQNDAIKYDIFFERIFNPNNFTLGILNSLICIDIYGQKNYYENKEYLLTSKKINYDVVATFGLCLRPHELNINENIEGEELTLYKIEEKKRTIEKPALKLNYYYKVVGKKNAVKLFLEFIKRILNKIYE